MASQARIPRRMDGDAQGRRQDDGMLTTKPTSRPRRSGATPRTGPPRMVAKKSAGVNILPRAIHHQGGNILFFPVAVFPSPPRGPCLLPCEAREGMNP